MKTLPNRLHTSSDCQAARRRHERRPSLRLNQGGPVPGWTFSSGTGRVGLPGLPAESTGRTVSGWASRSALLGSFFAPFRRTTRPPSTIFYPRLHETLMKSTQNPDFPPRGGRPTTILPVSCLLAPSDSHLPVTGAPDAPPIASRTPEQKIRTGGHTPAREYCR